MNTHTPGPWKIAHRMGRPIVVNSTPTHGGPLEICEAYTHPMAHETIKDALDVSEANARLIAAAPDLLAVLKSLVFETSHFLHGDGKNGASVANELRNAISALSKAEGGK